MTHQTEQAQVYLTEQIQIHEIADLFYIDAENNIPDSFSTLLLLFASLLLVVIATLTKKHASASSLHWSALAIGFFLMAVDETLSFHEKLIRPVRSLLGEEYIGIFYFAWVIPGILLVLLLALFFSGFLLRLPRKTRLSFLIAATLYLGGAIGFELIGGHFAKTHGLHNLAYIVIATAEESLEMGGIIVFIRALIVYIARNYREVRLQFEEPRF